MTITCEDSGMFVQEIIESKHRFNGSVSHCCEGLESYDISSRKLSFWCVGHLSYWFVDVCPLHGSFNESMLVSLPLLTQVAFFSVSGISYWGVLPQTLFLFS